ncbi:MAG: glycoside hydrolase family 2, partial [Clostridiaceae bacterium]|nr:glycoside hydrolase family 2 [Clostridiaceae bacterium]
MIKKLFNDGWKFSKQKLDTPPEMLDQDGIEWLDIDLPHDWLIYDTNNLYEASEGWYKKTFVPESIGDKVISIRFEGVYMDSTVFVNGKKAGEWKYGYSTFEFDITEHLVPGENEIKVRVVYRSPNSRWYSGAGIYRNVWLIATEPAHFVSDGIYISAKKGAEGWKVEVDAEIIDESDKYGDVAGENQDAVVRHTIIDADGNVTAVCEQKAALRHDTVVDSQVLTVGDPRLWSLEDPYLYKLKSELIVEGQVKDTVLQNFGFRTLRFDCNEGFFLNDVHVKLHGTCEHHDLGALGAAMNKTALRRQITMLKEMGVNSIRTSHNMPAVELMDLADEMGVLIVSEAFDMWERSKTEYDYARFFNEWCERDVASWVRRDRNHPSIIMWSIGNEIYDTHADERGLEITKMLRDLVKKHDPKQNGYVTIGSNYMRWDNAQRCMEEVEV